MPTFESIGTNSFALLQVFLPGETPGAADMEYARGAANRMLSGWGQRQAFIPFVARERFDLVANQGGPTNPYTIGEGGDFDTERPSNQNSLTAANLILTATSPEVRVPLGIYTDQAYDANKLPGMTNSQPTALYFNPTYASGFGSIYLWPVPSVSTNDLELFLQKSLTQFADISTDYDLPDGAEDVITYQLALRLQTPYGKQLDQEGRRLAAEVLGVFKRSNAKMSDLANDAYLFNSSRTLFNIQTGQ